MTTTIISRLRSTRVKSSSTATDPPISTFDDHLDNAGKYQALKIEWLESTLAYTREKIQMEEVLGHLLRDLAGEMTTIHRLHRLVDLSDALLESMRMESSATRQTKAQLEALNTKIEEEERHSRPSLIR